ncbi:MAG: DUF3592 domain-containing protein [Planctomycetota bacterium]|jgi:hypothetical protein
MRERHFLWVGFGLLLLGAGLAVPTASRVASSETADGRVHSVGNVSMNGEGFPVTIVFKDKRGKAHRLRTRTQRTTEFRPGQPVEVVYEPADPANTAQVNALFRVWLWPLVALIAGGLFIAFRRTS